MKPTILCVDDENIVLTSIKEQLKREFGGDYTIEIAESGEDALEILDEIAEDGKELSMVISDQIMPGIKGDELLIQIHEKFPHCLKILLTGQADAQAVGNAVNRAGLYRYISKPWDAMDLSLTIKEGLRRFFQEREIVQKNQSLLRNAETFYKFVPVQFLRNLDFREDSFSEIRLGSSKDRELTILFLDIRSFTTLCEIIPTSEIFHFLNSFLSYMAPIIHQNNGYIDKYIGDSIMALFENPDDAVRAAQGMWLALGKFNETRTANGEIPIAMGIGINSGKIILGTIGEESRMQTTVIGDAVNVAARIEALTKTTKSPILVSGTTVAGLVDPSVYPLEELPLSDIRGKLEGVVLYRLKV